MRRLAQHAIVGVGFSALVATAAVAGLSSPNGEGAALAAPLTATSTAAAPGSAVVSDTALAIAAERAQRRARAARDAARAKLVAEVLAKQRAAGLVSQGESIAEQSARLRSDAAAARKTAAKRKVAAAKAAKAAAARRAAAAAAARRKAVAKRGYAAGVTDPREMARQILKNKYGYDSSQFGCFNNIIMRESMWKVNATNPSSGAYGIPQALPGSKMATVASDWRTNPATQIIWAVGYMKDRYGSPCAAWSFKSSHGWY